MDNPYRECALVPLDYVPPKRDVFTYYVKERKGHVCPVCKEDMWTEFSSFTEPRECYPTKRIVVKGFWFWRKRCPLPGIHSHYTCPKCNALSVYFKHEEPELKESVLGG